MNNETAYPDRRISRFLMYAGKKKHIIRFFEKDDVLSVILCSLKCEKPYLLSASFTATATATVAPTMGLLPMPKNPIIST